MTVICVGKSQLGCYEDRLTDNAQKRLFSLENRMT